MKNNPILLLSILFSITFLLSNCNKEEEPWKEHFRECRDNMTFNCGDIMYDQTHFTAKIDGMDFCVSAVHDDYIEFIGPELIYRTLPGESFNTATTTPRGSHFSFLLYPSAPNDPLVLDYGPGFSLRTPLVPDTFAHPTIYYFDKFMNETGDLKMAGEDIDEFNGFYFGIYWNCQTASKNKVREEVNQNGYSNSFITVEITPSKGKQDNMTFRISEMEKTDLPSAILYEMTFEISCDLYVNNTDSGTQFFARLDDGIFKTAVLVAK